MNPAPAPPTRHQAPLRVSLLVGLLAAAILPWAARAVRPDLYFFPTVVAVAGCFDLLSMYLLAQQFRAEGDRRPLLMAVAYGWSLIVMLGSAGAFVPVWSTRPPLATAPSVAPWLYVLWHTSFPVLLALAWAPWPARLLATVPAARRRREAVGAMGAAVAGAVVAVTVLVLTGPALPVVVHGQDIRRLGTLSAPVAVPLVLLSALSTTWALRRRRGPERWTATAVWVSLIDLSLTYISGHRFSLGWYVGRTFTVVAAAVVLLAMLRETTRTRAALIDTLERERDLQRERVRREQMVRGIITNSPSLIYAKDLDGRYLLANEVFEQTFGVTEAEILGKDDTYLDPVLAPVWRLVDLRAQHGEVHAEEWTNEPHGRNCYESVKFPLRDADGVVYATCGISLDVTAARRATEALAEARDQALAAAAAKSAFLATMSHEIRTPMNAVIGLTDLLLDTTLDSDQRELVGIVRSSGDALLVIIDDVLDFSRIEAGELDLARSPFDLRDCVEDALALVALAAGARALELVADLDEGCPRLVVGDVSRFRQVVVNLLANAVKFTEHGEVVLAVRADPADPGLGPDEDRPVRVVVSVRDTGIGIPADAVDRLFRSFSQVDSSTRRVHGGTGLGLAISRRLARAMGGDLEVDSEFGVGSTFTFTAALTAVGERRAEPDPGAGHLARSSVLVVDDNGSSRRVLRELLERWGLVCTEAATAAAALALVSRGLIVDVVLIDMGLPGTDGHALARALRELPAGRDVPLVLLRSLESGLRQVLPGLFAATLTKPVRTQALRERLLGILAPTEAAVLAVESAGGHRRRDHPVLVDAAPLVLVVEDNAVNQKVAQLLLGRLGYRVETVANGLDAVDAVRRKTYDLVLMDVHMPVLDGLQATEIIRGELPADAQPRIVGVTASVLAEDRAACARVGMDGYLSKPIRADELAALLTAMLQRPAPTAPGGS